MMSILKSKTGGFKSLQAIVFAGFFSLFLASWGSFCGAHAQGLTGDDEALQRVELMIERIGGKELWANARTLYIEEKSYHPNTEGSIEAKFWRDLEKPGEWSSITAPELSIIHVWNTNAGWFSRNGEMRALSQEELEVRIDNWHREIYTLYHQLSAGERDLNVSTIGLNGFSVANEEGDKIGEFHLTKSGDLFFWQQFGDDPVAYVYGPKKDFGTLEFPDWGGSTDGNWRFYYVDIEVSSEPIEALVSMERPQN